MPSQELHSLGAKQHKAPAKHCWATKASQCCWQQAREGAQSPCPAPEQLHAAERSPGQEEQPQSHSCPSAPAARAALAACPWSGHSSSCRATHTLPIATSCPTETGKQRKTKFSNTFSTVRVFVPVSQKSVQLILHSYLL